MNHNGIVDDPVEYQVRVRCHDQTAKTSLCRELTGGWKLQQKGDHVPNTGAYRPIALERVSADVFKNFGEFFGSLLGVS